MKYLICYFSLLFLICITLNYFKTTYKFKPGECVYTNVTGYKLIKYITKTSFSKYYYEIRVHNQPIKSYIMRKKEFEALHDKIECPKL